jgi:hypothetical protein
MGEAGGDLDLAQEALGTDDGGELGVQDLDRHLAGVLQIVGQVDRGHATPAQLALKLVAVSKRHAQLIDHQSLDSR